MAEGIRKRKGGKHHSSEWWEAVMEEARRDGRSPLYLAQKYNLCYQTVKAHMLHDGIVIYRHDNGIQERVNFIRENIGNMSVEEIAESLNLAEDTVYSYIRKYQIPHVTRREQNNIIWRQRLEDCAKKKMTKAEIAKLYGVTRPAISVICRRLGINISYTRSRNAEWWKGYFARNTDVDVKDMARELDVGITTIRNMAKRLGVNAVDKKIYTKSHHKLRQEVIDEIHRLYFETDLNHAQMANMLNVSESSVRKYVYELYKKPDIET